MDGRQDQRHRLRKIDAAEFTLEGHRPPKRGRKKKLNAEQAALVFEALVQIRASQRLIDRVLTAAGVRTRSPVLTSVWRSRGRIDVQNKAVAPRPGEVMLTKPGVARRCEMRGGPR